MLRPARYLVELISSPWKNAAVLSIAANSVWLFAERVTILTLNLFVTLMVARHLGPTQFGTFSYLLAASVLLAPLGQLGLNSIVTRELINNPENSSTILGTSLVLRLFSGVVVVLIGVFLVMILRPRDDLMLAYIATLLIGDVFKAFLVFRHWLESEVKGKIISICSISIAVAIAVSKLCLVIYKASLSAFVIVQAVEGVLLALVFGLVYIGERGGVRSLVVSGKMALELLRQSKFLIISSVTAVIYLKIDQLMIGQMIDDKAVGVYAVAARISEVWYFIPVIIVTSAFPFLLKARQNDSHYYDNQLQTLFNLLLWVGVGFAFIVSLCAHFIVPFLFGNAYVEASQVLVIHVWAGVFVSVRALISKWLLAENILILSVVSQGAGAVSNVLLNIVMIPSYGIYGAAIATLISYSIASYFCFIFFRRTRVVMRKINSALYFPIKLIRHLGGSVAC